MIHQVNSALNLDRAKYQWVDLGIHPEACMTRPETCGGAGGAISFWLKTIDCPTDAGVISSYQFNRASRIFCYYNNIRYNTLFL